MPMVIARRRALMQRNALSYSEDEHNEHDGVRGEEVLSSQDMDGPHDQRECDAVDPRGKILGEEVDKAPGKREHDPAPRNPSLSVIGANRCGTIPSRVIPLGGRTHHNLRLPRLAVHTG